MATRRHLKHQDDVRAKIKTSQLLNRLQDHAEGKITLDASQVKAIEIMLKKAMPDLSAVEMNQVEEMPQESELMERILKLLDAYPDVKKRVAEHLNADLARTNSKLAVVG